MLVIHTTYFYLITLCHYAKASTSSPSIYCISSKHGKNVYIYNIYIIYKYIYIYIYIQDNFSTPLNLAIQRICSTLNILCSKCREEDESHPHFIFYCKLSKVTPDYISELINLNYSFNIRFKFSLKTIIMGSFSVL